MVPVNNRGTADPADIAAYLGRQNIVKNPHVSFLAVGEYNENYLVEAETGSLVFRINHGSQLSLDRQIEYEFAVLSCIAGSGVTPSPIFVDADAPFGNGVLVMQYVPGGPFDYAKDSEKAAEIFARVHSIEPCDGLITQPDAAAAIISECDGLLAKYQGHPRADRKTRLLQYRDTLLNKLEKNPLLLASDDMVVVNTEVNSGNFLVDGEQAYLVDWEKAVVSTRYQDLGHFLVPTTTLWKTDFRFEKSGRNRFLNRYRDLAGLSTGLEELSEITSFMEDVIKLRALSWCYMAYYEYVSSDRNIKNEDTFRRIEWYLDRIEWLVT